MMAIDGNGWNKRNSQVKQKAFCVHLKNRLLNCLGYLQVVPPLALIGRSLGLSTFDNNDNTNSQIST